jgi:L-ascorbate metabolism protein UlaG (beta-lactamase superfamily)
VGALVGLGGCMASRPFDEEAWIASIEATRVEDLYAPHREPSGRFYNPWARQGRSGWEFWRWVMSENSMQDLPQHPPRAPVVANSGDYLSQRSSSFSVTHVGHATFAIHWDEQVVLTDPLFSERAAVVKRLVPPAFGPEKIPAGAVVVISHNHYDHLDSDSLSALAGKARFLCPLGLGDTVRKRGAENVRELDWWETVQIDGTAFTCLPAQHWSRRFGQGYNETLWCSWLIERDGRRIYFGGDSGYFKGFREYGRKYPGIEVALLPIGAYTPRWFMHYAHMNPSEVLQAFEDLGADTMIPTQWGVLELGDEPAAWPATALRQTLDTTHPHLKDRVQILPVGDRLILQ